MSYPNSHPCACGGTIKIVERYGRCLDTGKWRRCCVRFECIDCKQGSFRECNAYRDPSRKK